MFTTLTITEYQRMHMHHRKPIFLLLTLSLLVGLTTAQVPQVRVSQFAEIKQTVGLADITVRYHRPGVKGRTIWGELLPYGEIWRAGANEPTLVTFTEDVNVAGQNLTAGMYRIVVTPMKDGPWVVIFNSEVKNWGTVYDKSFDVARVEIAPTKTEHEEWMSFSFDRLTASTAEIVLRWESVALHIPVSFDTERLFTKKTASIESDVWRVKNSYARYLLDYGTDMDEALRISEEAIALNQSATTLRTKAEILGNMDKFDEAISVMREAIRVGKEQNPDMNTSFYEGFITRWSDMR